MRAPTLLVTGAEDGRYTGIAADMQRRMPDAQHVAVPGVGHTVHLEDPSAWLSVVEPFLDRAPVPEDR